jgi:glucose-6-phosphate 1-dehydrogenase
MRDLQPYARLLGDAMKGDASLFARQDAIELQWRIIDPVLDLPSAPYQYDPGSWGPPEADRLVAAIPGGWREPIEPTIATAASTPSTQGGSRESKGARPAVRQHHPVPRG